MIKIRQFIQQFENKSITHNAKFIFAIALIVRLLLILLLRPYHDLARFELERTALSLANTGVYGNPYAIPTGPTAHVSPGYTVILAALFHTFGSGVMAEILKELLASTVVAFSCALIPFAAVALHITKRTGLIAALLCALLPVKPLVQIDGDWEAPYAALFLVALTAAVSNQWNKRDTSLSTALFLGILWGGAVLFSSVLLPIFVATLLCGTVLFFHLLRPYLRACAIQLAVAGLCLLPWIVRNQFALGAPIATRSNFGIEMRVSNNDQATPDQRVNYDLGVYDRYHPLQNAGEAAKVRAMGEVAYNKAILQDTRAWISTHTSRFVQLCLGRFACFWFYPDPSKAKALFGDLTAVLGITGFILLWRKSTKSGLLLTIIFLLYPAASYLIQVGARQRYPIDWLLTLLSVYTVVQSTNWLRRTKLQ